MKTKKLKTVKQADQLFIQFNEWFDKSAGNTYYDATVYIADNVIKVPFCYGSNAGDKQSIDEALYAAGYKIRACKSDWHRHYRRVRYSVGQVKKSELNR